MAAVQPLTLKLYADTRLAMLFIRLASVLVLLGWSPSERAQDMIARAASKLVRVRVAKEGFPIGEETTIHEGFGGLR